MLKILYWLLFDAFTIYGLITLWSEMGKYTILIIAMIAFFTWELINSIKQWLE